MTFWFLSTPYSLYPGGLDAAHEMACEQLALLQQAGVPVFSPIAHSHNVARFGKIDPKDAAFWVATYEPFIRLACGMILLRAESWEQSEGMAMERQRFARDLKPIIAMDPGQPPTQTFLGVAAVWGRTRFTSS